LNRIRVCCIWNMVIFLGCRQILFTPRSSPRYFVHTRVSSTAARRATILWSKKYSNEICITCTQSQSISTRNRLQSRAYPSHYKLMSESSSSSRSAIPVRVVPVRLHYSSLIEFLLYRAKATMLSPSVRGRYEKSSFSASTF
jgi:hypothetical protein